MAWLPCPFLGADVEFTDERPRHVAEDHPDLLPKCESLIREALTDPD